MPRILLVSFHYRPMGVVAAERARAWAENLAQLGWRVDVITHDWVHDGTRWRISEELIKREEVNERLTLHRLGLTATAQKRRMQGSAWKIRMEVLRRWASGWFDPDPIVRPSHEALFDYASELLKSEAFDLIFTIHSPFAHVRLACELHRASGVPYHVDFRDLDDNLLVRSDYRPKGAMGIRHAFVKRYWKRWLRNALSISAATVRFKEHLENEYQTNCLAVHTGFERARLQEPREASSVFRLVYTGSVYTHQHYKVFAEAIRRFLAEEKAEEIEVIFQGVEREVDKERPGGYSAQAVRHLKTELDDDRVVFGPRIGVSEVRKLQRNSSVLLLPTQDDINIPGKIFEYLGSQTRILAVPDTQASVVQIINDAGAGKCVATPQEAAAILHQWYAEWKTSNPLPPLTALEQRIPQSQEKRAEELSVFLKERLGVSDETVS